MLANMQEIEKTPHIFFLCELFLFSVNELQRMILVVNKMEGIEKKVAVIVGYVSTKMRIFFQKTNDNKGLCYLCSN